MGLKYSTLNHLQRLNPRSIWPVLFALLFGVFLSTGCVAVRDFQSPKQRITAGTAYTLTKGEMRANVGLLSTEIEGFGIAAGFAYGFGKHAEVSANFGHAALGILNVQGKYNFVDEKWWALGVQLGVMWIRPSAVWALPDATQYKYEGADVLSLPLKISSSFPVAEWVGLHLAVGYTHSVIFGTIDNEFLFFDGSVGMRQVYLQPLITFYFAERAAVFIGAHLQIWGATRTLLETEVVVLPGFNAGARSDDWVRVAFEKRSHLAVGFELKFGKTTHTRFSLIYNGAFSRSEIIAIPIAPVIELYWRF